MAAIKKENLSRLEDNLAHVRSVLATINSHIVVNVGLLEPDSVDADRQFGYIVDVPAGIDTNVETVIENQFSDLPYEIRVVGDRQLHELLGGDHCGFSESSMKPPPLSSMQLQHGTLGAIFQTSTIENPNVSMRCLISCSHVIAQSGYAALGDKVATNPQALLGTGRDVATLCAFTGLGINTSVRVDAAIALLHSQEQFVDQAVRRIGDSNFQYNRVSLINNESAREQLRSSLVGVKVFKTGVSTGTTHGRIDAVKHDTPIGPYRYLTQLRIVPEGDPDFSVKGDSGSLVISEDTHEPVGLLVGGFSFTRNGIRGSESYATFIQDVLLALRLNSI